MDIVLATRNKKKVEEIKKIFHAIGIPAKIFTLDDFPDCPEVEEDGNTFKANAIKKAEHVLRCAGITAIADDSGLEVEALNGEPGVLSARYAGVHADDKANYEKLLKKMEGISEEKRNARFVCCIAMASKGNVKTFSGYVSGRIAREPKGKNGFGYDPIFYPHGYDRTFAEMSDEEKNTISHRAMALNELKNYFKSIR